MKLTIWSTVALAVMLRCQVGAQIIYDTNNVVVQTFVGSGFYGYFDGQGIQTMFHNPSQIVSDPSGDFFLWDSGNSRIRKITPDGTVSTFLYLPGYYNEFITIDHSDNLWMVAYYYNSGTLGLFRITNQSIASSINLIPAFIPGGICVDSANNFYISDPTGNHIYRGTTNGIEVFAGSGNPGAVDGNWIFTSFNHPTALAADSADNIYVWDSSNYEIRRINQNRDVITITGGSSATTDGPNPSFNSVSAMTVDGSGNLILACGSSVRKMSVTTNAVTLAGDFPQTGYTNGPGNLARFNGASGVCVFGGTIYVADSNNQRIRSITNNPTAQVVSPANLRLFTFPGLEIIGTVGRTYQIQTSPDMSTWGTVATLLLTSSPYLWIDQNPLSGNKFYRALLLP